MDKLKYINPIPSLDDEETSSRVTIPFTFASPVTRKEAAESIGQLISNQIQQNGSLPMQWVKLGEPTSLRYATAQPNRTPSLVHFNCINDEHIYVLIYAIVNDADIRAIQDTILQNKTPYDAKRIIDAALDMHISPHVRYEIIEPHTINI